MVSPIIDCRLQAVRSRLRAAAHPVHADANEMTYHAIRATTTKGKKKRRIVQVSLITECTGGWPWVLPTRLRHTAMQPLPSREYLRTAAAPARPIPYHDASLSPLAGPKTHASGEGCACERVGKRPILKKQNKKTPESGYRCRCRCSRAVMPGSAAATC